MSLPDDTENVEIPNLQFFYKLEKMGKIAVFQWCMKQGLVSNKFICPVCGVDMKLAEKRIKYVHLLWKCNNTKKHKGKHDVTITAKAGSFFQGKGISVSRILMLVYLWVKNCSEKFILYELGISRPAVHMWMTKKLPEVCLDISFNESSNLGGENVIVEINTLLWKKNCKKNQWILGGVENVSNKYFFEVTDEINKHVLYEVIQKRVWPGSTVILLSRKISKISDKSFQQFSLVDSNIKFRDFSKEYKKESLWYSIKESLLAKWTNNEFNSCLTEFMWRRYYSDKRNEIFQSYLRALCRLYPRKYTIESSDGYTNKPSSCPNEPQPAPSRKKIKLESSGAEYWKSLPRKFCDICKCWFADNKASIDFHERGKRHQENAQKRIQDIQKRGIKDFKKQKQLENEMEKIEKAALAAYEKDLQNMQGGDKSQLQQQTAKTSFIKSSEPVIKPKVSTKSIMKPQTKPKETTPVHSTPQIMWYEAVTEEGHKYYWNAETSESRWEPPEEGFISEEFSEEQTQLDSETVSEEKQVETVEKTNCPIKEESDDDEKIPCSIGPQPKIDPYGQWVTVVKQEPVEYDLQLPAPTENVVEVVIPVHKDEPAVKFKEKVIGRLSDTDGADPGEVTFKKRKFSSSAKKNARQRIDDD